MKASSSMADESYKNRKGKYHDVLGNELKPGDFVIAVFSRTGTGGYTEWDVPSPGIGYLKDIWTTENNITAFDIEYLIVPNGYHILTATKIIKLDDNLIATASIKKLLEEKSDSLK